MKQFLIIAGSVLAIALASCGPRRSPGRAYMPDMFYSRAYETYAALDTAAFTTDRNNWGKDDDKIFYNEQPVAGTVARGDMAPYQLKNDSAGYCRWPICKRLGFTQGISCSQLVSRCKVWYFYSLGRLLRTCLSQ